MPSLMRFLFVLGVLAAIVAGGLVFLAIYFEPQPGEIRQPVHDVKIRK